MKIWLKMAKEKNFWNPRLSLCYGEPREKELL